MCNIASGTSFLAWRQSACQPENVNQNTSMYSLFTRTCWHGRHLADIFVSADTKKTSTPEFFI